MKKKLPLLVDLVCNRHCSYYKPNAKEELACRGYERLETVLSENPELAHQIRQIQAEPFKDKAHQTLRHLLCRHCDFFIEGCDFTDPDVDQKVLPCGGYIVLDKLLEHIPMLTRPLLEATITDNEIAVLSPGSVLKKLEALFLYDLRTDELYELDDEGFSFLSKCDGTRKLAKMIPDTEFLESCLEEGLLEIGNAPEPRRFIAGQSPTPSLRYLELQITNRCNLACKHCYLGPSRNKDMPLSQIRAAVEMFEKMQGLRLLVSGGEPLLHPEISLLKPLLSQAQIRTVLLTNGTLIREDNFSLWGFFDEIQFSLDGLKDGHEALRGTGTYDRTIAGVDIARKKGLDVSIATMVHRRNLSELDKMASWIEREGVVEWNIDVPCESGRLAENADLAVTPEEGAPFLKLAKGGSYHGSEEPFACGYHLCTVTPEGDVLKCGFFPEQPLGSIQEGLCTCWKRLEHPPLSDLECHSCPHLLACKGGCRFRAPTPLGKDPVMCALFRSP